MEGRNLDSLAKEMVNKQELSENAHMHCEGTM